MRRTIRERLWTKPAKGIAGLLLALLTAEIATRSFYCVENIDDPVFGAIYKPGSTVKTSTEGFAISHWTEWGVRGRRPPAPGVKPILCIGDSYTEAVMVNDDEVFTGRLEKALGSVAPGLTVLNVGRGGRALPDYILLSATYRKLFQPRWTVVQVCAPDLGSDAWNPSKQLPDRSFAFFKRGKANELRIEVPPFRRASRLEMLLRRSPSMALRYAGLQLRDFVDATSRQPTLFRATSDYATSTISTSTADMETNYPIEEELDMLWDAYDGRMTLTYIPRVDFFSPAKETMLEERIRSYCSKKGLSYVTPRRFYPEVIKKGMAPFGFSNTRFNFGHLNAVGHDLLARALTEELARLCNNGVL